jgi:hypothetical protein
MEDPRKTLGKHRFQRARVEFFALSGLRTIELFLPDLLAELLLEQENRNLSVPKIPSWEGKA